MTFIEQSKINMTESELIQAIQNLELFSKVHGVSGLFSIYCSITTFFRLTKATKSSTD